jgi:hypothetical protein
VTPGHDRIEGQAGVDDVGLRDRHPGLVVLGEHGTRHRLAPPVLDHRFRRLGAGPVEAVERALGHGPEDL